MSSLEQVVSNGFASCYRFWLCFTFCAQFMSLDRQNALDRLNWILVLKHIWQKKQSKSLINGHFNPWSKYYIILNLLFIKTTFELPTCVYAYWFDDRWGYKLCLHARQNNINNILTQQWWLSNQPGCTFTHALNTHTPRSWCLIAKLHENRLCVTVTEL